LANRKLSMVSAFGSWTRRERWSKRYSQHRTGWVCTAAIDLHL